MSTTKTAKPIPIPRDLKPGDRLWYSETEFATVCAANGNTPGMAYFEDDFEDQSRGLICAQTSSGTYMNYWCDTGMELEGDTPPIVRIIRKTSKPARVDRDAAYLLWLERRDPVLLGPAQKKRLRAIARRLNGEGK